VSVPNQQVINDLACLKDDLLINPVSNFNQACENFYQHFEMMTGEQVGSLNDVEWWINHWNGNDWLNEI